MMPSGSATIIAMTLVRIVAFSKGKMPNLRICGCHTVPVRNSSTVTSGRWKKSNASRARTKMIPRVVKMLRMPHANSSA